MSAKKIFCCVTMDVEVDKDPHYRVSSPSRFRNVTEAIPHLLEPLFCELGVKPTYLLSSEVMQDKESVAVLKQLRSQHELGTHGHAELLGPEVDVSLFAGKPMHDFINDYPPEVQREKLSWLTELFIKTFGYPPRSFRAGRFGVNGYTLRILQDLGYQVDSSVTPGLYWYNNHQVLNFIHAPEQPYHPDEEDVTKIGELDIWEVPVSSWEASSLGKKVRAWLASGNPAPQVIPEIAKKILLKATSRLRWLRPTNFSPATLRRWVDNYIKRNANRDNVFIIIMFHPLELIPGASPYSLNPKKAKMIINNLRQLLLYINDKQIKFITLSEIAAYLL
jgi:hypothetical protein